MQRTTQRRRKNYLNCLWNHFDCNTGTSVKGQTEIYWLIKYQPSDLVFLRARILRRGGLECQKIGFPQWLAITRWDNEALLRSFAKFTR